MQKNTERRTMQAPRIMQYSEKALKALAQTLRLHEKLGVESQELFENELLHMPAKSVPATNSE